MVDCVCFLFFEVVCVRLLECCFFYIYIYSCQFFHITLIKFTQNKVLLLSTLNKKWFSIYCVYNIYNGKLFCCFAVAFLLLSQCPGDKLPLLQAIGAAAAGALGFFHLHSFGVRLEPNVSSWLSPLSKFCEAYIALASGSHALGLCRFHLEPSLHGFYTYFELRGHACDVLNPASHSCEADEDYVGGACTLALQRPGSSTDFCLSAISSLKSLTCEELVGLKGNEHLAATRWVGGALLSWEC